MLAYLLRSRQSCGAVGQVTVNRGLKLRDWHLAWPHSQPPPSSCVAASAAFWHHELQ
jgi:hypothetical protein